ncbi:hypothetical protein BDP27DRAFT_1324949 [Rhodocollybia butyracea]|uniref:F-box domain-containing protein n=1 Tax=Rhodocollybia butyracea TaxID=206335 RepID=A0A9P5PV84_9AGAR|nr:hypothetical protein BDP27DRAFT_1324949 [Rhodocollybia butyracea]
MTPFFPSEFPLAQLSQLRVRVIDEANMGTLARRSINLKALNISDICVNRKISDDILVLPTAYLLETLTVRLRRVNGVTATVFPFFKGPWAYFGHFMAFVQRSSFPLTNLFIERVNLPDSSMVHLLAHVPTLLDFTLIDTNVPPEESPITEGLIESLHAYRYQNTSLRPLNGPLLPRLRSLKLTYNGVVFNDQAVVDMIKSRWTSDFNSNREVDCLRSFTMTYRRRKKVLGVYDVLDHIEKDGMRLVILWRDDLARSR